MADEVEIFVCVTCAPRADSTASPRPGAVLAQLLNARLAELGAAGIKVREVECLAVCKRPSTIAMTAAGKWTYIIGDLLAEEHVGDIAAAALAFQRSATGIVPWGERPVPFRKGVVARVPPLGFEQPATETA